MNTEKIDTAELVAELDGILKIPSVATAGDEMYPFGIECDYALDYILELCRGYGFRVKKCGNLTGWAEIGEGKEMVGILAHLDVVPAGDGWKYPPYGCTFADGRLYGRGISDDKGPAMLCIWAMKRLLDSGKRIDRRIRIIFGLTEEAGEWKDMKYYCQHEELPTFGFTPDACFPVAYLEKGILMFNIIIPKKGLEIDSIVGGKAYNIVPDHCEAVVGQKKIISVGKSAHGSEPIKGNNAIIAVADKLGGKLGSFIKTHFNPQCDGEGLGCKLSDSESGELTLNLGMIESDEENVTFCVDVRYPISTTGDKVVEKVRATLAGEGAIVKKIGEKAPVYMDRQSELVKKLTAVYCDITGTSAEPYGMGGGTYARAMPNIIAFGAHLPEDEGTEHQANENVKLESFLKALEIYTQAIERLARE